MGTGSEVSKGKQETGHPLIGVALFCLSLLRCSMDAVAVRFTHRVVTRVVTTADEALIAEIGKPIPWNHPCRGINGDLIPSAVITGNPAVGGLLGVLPTSGPAFF